VTKPLPGFVGNSGLPLRVLNVRSADKVARANVLLI
jgi:hypothetical protein